MPSVLFVCSGNICRSPMAEGIFRTLLKEKGLGETWQASSAGTLDLPPSPASPEARQALAEQGIDIREHRSRRVTRQILEGADLVLVMTSEHLETLHEAASDLAGRIYLLSQMAGQEKDVNDPIGYGLPYYREAAGQIRQYLEEGWDTILDLAQKNAQSAG